MPFVRGLDQLDGAVMQFDDPFDDRHAQPGAAAGGARLIADDKRLEQRIRDGGRDADAVVRDGQMDGVRRFAQGEKQRGAARVVLECVAGQIVKQAAQQLGIGLAGNGMVRKAGLEQEACGIQLGVFSAR